MSCTLSIPITFGEDEGFRCNMDKNIVVAYWIVTNPPLILFSELELKVVLSTKLSSWKKAFP